MAAEPDIKSRYPDTSILSNILCQTFEEKKWKKERQSKWRKNQKKKLKNMFKNILKNLEENQEFEKYWLLKKIAVKISREL